MLLPVYFLQLVVICNFSNTIGSSNMVALIFVLSSNPSDHVAARHVARVAVWLILPMWYLSLRQGCKPYSGFRAYSGGFVFGASLALSRSLAVGFASQCPPAIRPRGDPSLRKLFIDTKYILWNISWNVLWKEKKGKQVYHEKNKNSSLRRWLISYN